MSNIKISDYPEGTIVEVDNELFMKDGVIWRKLNDGNSYFYTLGAMNTRTDGGHVSIVGIPYPVALKLAEWARRDDNPEELVIKAGRMVD